MFENLTYESFRERAKSTLTPSEKVGFPESSRRGRKEHIFNDIVSKLSNLQKEHQIVMDIGCGCDSLADMIAGLCWGNDSHLIQVDSPEMLALLPDYSFVTKIPGQYPVVQAIGFKEVDAILAYSVIQYNEPFAFINRAIRCLAPGGQFLIGDIPNTSMRERFRKTPAGCGFPPSTGTIDDNLVMAILIHCRAQGFNAFVLPQGEGLPMANRREDILVCRP